MSLSLSQAIKACPKSLFGKAGKNPPDYPGILAVVAKALLTDAGVKFDGKTVDAMAEVINPSTLQRMVATRRAAITGLQNRDGTYEPIPELKPKAVKATLPKAAKGADPINGKKTATKAPSKAKVKKAASGKKLATPGEKSGMARTKEEGPGPAKPAKKIAKPAKAAAPAKGADLELSALAAARASLAAKKDSVKAAPAVEDPDDVI